MSDLEIVLNKKVDRITITDDTTIDVVNNYASEGVERETYKFSDLTAPLQEDLLSVLDALSFGAEADAFVFVIERDEKDFDLTGSYIRDAISTDAPTAMTAGQSLKVRFEVPGFFENTFREISLFYDQDFLTADLDLLAEIGVTLAGNGSAFTVANSIQTKVMFSKPDTVSDYYIIVDFKQDEILSL
jgi:hypothetical protein